jgi:hypothetical protein
MEIATSELDDGLVLKRKFKGLEIAGFRWAGYMDGLHFFLCRERSTVHHCEKHGEVLATTEDIENGNAEWMIRNGYTRIEGS